MLVMIKIIKGHETDHLFIERQEIFLGDMKKIFLPALAAGVLLFIVSYGGLFLAIKNFPKLFIDYINPLFSSDRSRYILFYTHAFVISFALSWFWERFKGLFKGYFVLRGLEFGLVYAGIALAPVMWITYSSLDITFAMVASWFFYGLCQAAIAGIIFAKMNP
jgi:hypothetical protein